MLAEKSQFYVNKLLRDLLFSMFTFFKKLGRIACVAFPDLPDNFVAKQKKNIVKNLLLYIYALSAV